MDFVCAGEGEYVFSDPAQCKSQILRVAITEGTTEIALAFLYRIFSDEIFGSEQLIFISLYETRQKARFLESVMVEITEFAPNLLAGYLLTHERSVAFKDADVVVAIGKARGYEFTEEEYAEPFFKDTVLVAMHHGQAIDLYAKKDVKVIVIGTTAATIIYHYAKSIAPTNITALSIFNVKMAAAHIAYKVGCLPDEVKNIIIWGTNNKHTFADCRFLSLNDNRLLTHEVAVWLRNDLPHIIQTTKNRRWYTRSLAYALADHCKLLWHGTREGEWTCMGVLSDNSYDVRSEIFFSYPVTCANQEYRIVQSEEIYDDIYIQRHIRRLSKFVATEVNAALKICKSEKKNREVSV